MEVLFAGVRGMGDGEEKGSLPGSPSGRGLAGAGKVQGCGLGVV
jgi:hypothetical protein